MISWAKSALVVLVMLGIGVFALAQAPDLSRMDLVEKSIPDGPVAKINGTNISAQEFRNLYRAELSRLELLAAGDTITDADRIRMGMRCLGMLLEKEVLYQEAERRGIQVSDAEIDKAWGDQVDRLRHTFSKDPEALISEEDALKMAGLSREQAREQLARSLRIKKMRDAIIREKGVSVSDEEVRAFYDEEKDIFRRPDLCHIEQIFARGGDTDEQREAARKRAEDALKRIQAGQRFEAVAKSLSDSPDAEKGGDLGAQPLDALPPFYAEAVKKMTPGEVSGIIESEFGFHIIKLIDMQPGQEAQFDQVKSLIRDELLQRKATAPIKEFAQELLEKGDVQTYLEIDRAIMAHPDADGLVKELGME